MSQHSQNLLKLSQGEYVALDRDSLQLYLVGVLVPGPVQFAALASRVWKTHVSEKD